MNFLKFDKQDMELYINVDHISGVNFQKEKSGLSITHIYVDGSDDPFVVHVTDKMKEKFTQILSAQSLLGEAK